MHPSETPIYNAVLIASACIVSIILYFVIVLILQQKRYRKFYNSRVSTEIDQIEYERRRIADMLHDDLGPLLFAARMKFASLDVYDDNNRRKQEDALQKLDELSGKLRAFNRELIPSGLFKLGIQESVIEFFNFVNNQSGLELSFVIQKVPVLPQTSTIHIYRILQEIVFNTIKHAKASNIIIEMYQDKNQFIISTADDGIGFNYFENTRSPDGQGLKNIINRADLLKGDIHVASRPGKGTRFFISIPI